jgi:tetratricopeptide (TPR) repeat protein
MRSDQRTDHRADQSNKDLKDLDDLACEHFTKGSDALDQGNLDAALKHYQGSLAIYRKLVAAEPDCVHWQEEMALSQMWVGAVLERQGKITAARARYQKSLAICRRLAADNPSDTFLSWGVACTQDRLAGALEEQGDVDGALRNLQGSLSEWRRLIAADPSNATRRGLADNLLAIGRLLKLKGDIGGAGAHMREALTVCETLARKNAASPMDQDALSFAHDQLGTVLMEKEDYQGALGHFEKALAIARNQGSKEPRVQHWLETQAMCLENVGDALDGLERPEEALQHYERSADLTRRLISRDNKAIQRSTLSFLHEKMGSTLHMMGDLRAALENQREALRIMQQLANEQPGALGWQEDLACILMSIGAILEAARDLSGAYRTYIKAQQIRERLVDLEPGNTDRSHSLFTTELRLDELKLRLMGTADERHSSRH